MFRFDLAITPTRSPKKGRRKNHRRKKGHRQHFTEIQITGITA